ncbi:LPS export ABC transporter periplasmic protein LptC [Amphritea japonica]|uniref:Lipopolysaccharide export system protein LptC n=1 Tax=Amphritea japonica ATCC BAA-1530 TaxID=1278309 RepID=A0A7R6PC38_9GAMM|nr:LPS export ABC transporter periplasmic protein LptC [Amphritea japonica]BBB27277.1 lipopolysaccharide export system protein LptC [Amphritea japonica ATCC BAA-1530]
MLTGRARLAAAAAILIPAVIYLGMDEERRPNKIKQEPNPAYQQSDYYIINGRIRDYDNHGHLKQQLSSSQLEHQPVQQLILVTNPELQLYSASLPSHKASSASGIIRDNNDSITLDGTVLLQDSPDPQQANILQTESLIFYPQKNLAQTDKKVTITNTTSTTTSVGMTIDTDSGILKLLSEVTGVHNAN